MSLLNMRRRVRHLEAALADALVPDYPPYSSAEIAELNRRIDAGEQIPEQELRRLAQHSPIGNREVVMMYRYGGVVKRLLGVDFAQL